MIRLKLGLLIIDMQKGLLNGQVEQHQIESACEYINYVADLLRSNNQTVVHVKDVEGAEDPNGEELAFIPEIRVDPRDIQVEKMYSNAFWKTELDAALKAEGVEFLVVAGFAAEHCVLFTYNGALERGYKAAMLHRGILSTKNDVIDSTYRDRHIVSYPAIAFMADLLKESRGEK